MPSSSPPIQPSSSTPPNSRKPCICTVCQPNHSYASLQYLKRHQKRHNPQITCQSPTCSILFPETKDMERHFQTRHPGVLPPERYFCLERGCVYASKGFSRKDNLMRHLKDAHGCLGR
ncbi:hypothetical protein BGZ57DRAFT_898234 [Hyaloscypha finlandica]|nr:hypothetical protein F5882DRAFT_14649 [Hyaloscypha sp. PMI_1271]KAH8769307.1 hypothetical protein BGZ57DRAFT_898234 [Hyaloscypha finlandica]